MLLQRHSHVPRWSRQHPSSYPAHSKHHLHHSGSSNRAPWRQLSLATADADASTTAPALDQRQVALQLAQQNTPPSDYDYKADVLPETLEVVSQQYPQLMPLVEAGNLVVYRRPSTYQERRTDGYQEPQLVFILGTAHVSQQSADDITQVIQAVQPDAVVVELCKSRTGVLHAAGDGAGGKGGDDSKTMMMQQQQHEKQQQEQRQLQAHQQRWQQQWQQWQQRRRQQEGGGDQPLSVAPVSDASSSSVTSSLEEELQPTTTSISSNSSSSSISSRNGSSSSSSSSSFNRKASNPLSLSGANPVSALARSAQLGGQQAMLLRLLMAGQARKAADQLGVQPGAEFRAAAEAAAAVPGGQCCLVLGDRPIEITLSRAWEALSWQRRLQLLGDLVSAGVASSEQATISQEQVESLRSDDAISALFNALSTRYPELVAPLITERDLYLSWSLKRSKAVNGTRAVVGCVGKGHLRGIVYALKNDGGSLRFKDLVGGKNNRRNRREAAAAAVRRFVLELLLGAAAYAAWVAYTSSGSS